MKKKVILFVVMFAIVLSGEVADSGIKFFKGTYSEVIEPAK